MIFRNRGVRGLDPIDYVTFQDDKAKLLVLVVLGVSYLLGTYCGAYLHSALQVNALLVPAGITGLAGFAYLLHRVSVLKQSLFSAAEIDIVDIPVAMCDMGHTPEDQPTQTSRSVSKQSNLSGRSHAQEPQGVITSSPDPIQLFAAEPCPRHDVHDGSFAC